MGSVSRLYISLAFFNQGIGANGTHRSHARCHPNPATRKGWPHHRGLRPLLFSNSGVGYFTSHENRSVKVLVRPGFEPATSRSADRRSTNWANQAAVKKKLLVNDKIKAFCSTKTLPKHYIKRYKQQKWTLKTCYAIKSFQKPTIAIRFNLLQDCPSGPPFVLAVLFIPSFTFLSGYFYVSLNLVAVPRVRILIKFLSQLL